MLQPSGGSDPRAATDDGRTCVGANTKWGKIIGRVASAWVGGQAHVWTRGVAILPNGTVFADAAPSNGTASLLDPCAEQPLSINHYSRGPLSACLYKARNGDHAAQWSNQRTMDGCLKDFRGEMLTRDDTLSRFATPTREHLWKLWPTAEGFGGVTRWPH